VRLKVLAVRGNRVQLGIEAPRDVAVHRAEHFAGGRIAPDGRPGERTEPVPVPAQTAVTRRPSPSGAMTAAAPVHPPARRSGSLRR
jgi:hypothetical protein